MSCWAADLLRLQPRPQPCPENFGTLIFTKNTCGEANTVALPRCQEARPSWILKMLVRLTVLAQIRGSRSIRGPVVRPRCGLSLAVNTLNDTRNRLGLERPFINCREYLGRTWTARLQLFPRCAPRPKRSFAPFVKWWTATSRRGEGWQNCRRRIRNDYPLSGQGRWPTPRAPAACARGA